VRVLVEMRGVWYGGGGGGGGVVVVVVVVVVYRMVEVCVSLYKGLVI